MGRYLQDGEPSTVGLWSSLGPRASAWIIAYLKTLHLESQLITDRHRLHVARSDCAVVTSGDSVYVLGGITE